MRLVFATTRGAVTSRTWQVPLNVAVESERRAFDRTQARPAPSLCLPTSRFQCPSLSRAPYPPSPLPSPADQYPRPPIPCPLSTTPCSLCSARSFSCLPLPGLPPSAVPAAARVAGGAMHCRKQPHHRSAWRCGGTQCAHQGILTLSRPVSALLLALLCPPLRTGDYSDKSLTLATTCRSDHDTGCFASQVLQGIKRMHLSVDEDESFYTSDDESHTRL